MQNLSQIITSIREFPGLRRKKEISKVLPYFSDLFKTDIYALTFGDDAAVLPYKSGYLLFAADSIIPSLVTGDPFFAGRVAVLVALNDIFAMGGRPLAIVNVIQEKDDQKLKLILKGMRHSCLKFNVPVVGGHYHPEEGNFIAVASIGTAKKQKILPASNSQTGDDIIVVIDLKGKPGTNVIRTWDAFEDKDPQIIRQQYEMLPRMAEEGLCHAAKDISNAGVIGSIALLLESSSKGGYINLEKIPHPDEVSIEEWIFTFPSYGFILTANSVNSEKIINLFRNEGIEAAVIGSVTNEKDVILKHGNNSAVLFSWSSESIIKTGKNIYIGGKDNP